MLRSLLRAPSLARAALRARAPPGPPRARLSTAAPAAAPRAVGWWLAGVAGGVYAMVVLGGVTRLTRSGLSIVEWRPEGDVLPSTPAEWDEAFAKYKATPEYARVNSRMTLDEFKPIYWMEWAHRAWGRALGVGFGLPLAALVAARAVPAGLAPRLGGLLALGGAQGAVGWWMVKSGLDARNFAPTDTPRVSPYRLAAHLSGAWAIYSVLAWTAMDLLRAPAAAAPAAAAAARAVRPAALAAAAVLGATTLSGAFVAGNDAGHAYNDWPLFAGRLVPEEIWDAALGARNFFENTATVQFDHRALAYATVAAVGGLHAAIARAPGGAAALPPPVRAGARALAAVVAAQAALGVTTLVLYVPVELGAAHQAGALAAWTTALWTLHAVRAAAAARAGPWLGGAAAAAAAAAAPRGAAAGAALAAAALCAAPGAGARGSE